MRALDLRPSDRFNELFRTYGSTIYARCRRLLGDDAAAQDATQETFIRVYRHLDSAPNTEEALRWIYRISTNLCLNQIRDRKRLSLTFEEAPEPLDFSLEERLVNLDLARRLIGRAPEHLRAPAWMHYVDGLDQGEVAVTLQVSRRTVVNYLGVFAQVAKKFMMRETA